MAILISTKGSREGVCNICGDCGPLTEDHTPPLGCINVSKVEMRHIVDRLSASQPGGKGRISQNGVKYRTLCPTCNNERLGACYDKEFIQFVNSVGRYLKSRIRLPRVMPVTGQPQKIMRSLLGHLAAQGVDRYLKGEITEPFKKYFLNQSEPLPDCINIYYWVYPYRGQVLARDCALVDLRVGEPASIWFMKFFPIAFMVTWNEPDGYDFGLPSFTSWRNLHFDADVEIPIHLDTDIHQFWPEAPTRQSILYYGESAIFATDQPTASNSKHREP